MTNAEPRPQTKGRTAPKLFDAQNASGTLLLLSGSLALGLTTYWMGSSGANTGTTMPVTATAPNPTAYLSEDSGYGDEEEVEDWEDDWRGAGSSQAQPGFSSQPMSQPRGWSRGS